MTAGMDDLRIEWEWQAAPGVRSPELRATWARIEVAVGADNVTLVEDTDSSSSRRSIYCPMYPLAEWIAYNWWLLQVNSRPALSVGLLRDMSSELLNVERDRTERHCLRSIGDGFLWPNLYIIPEGSETLLRWSADGRPPESKRIRYLSQGYKFVDSRRLVQVLANLVESVIARLADQGVSNLPLHEEWDAITCADADEVKFCLASARLGLDPYSEADFVEGALHRAGSVLEGALLEDFLNAADPRQLEAGLDWVLSARSAVVDSVGGQEFLFSIGETVRRDVPELRPPWQLGWRQARRVRKELGLDPMARVDPGNYVTSITRSSNDRGLQAVGGRGRNQKSATVVVGRSPSNNARRFTLSRALWHFLAEDAPLFIIASTYTDRQKIERAFAAELLAPADGIGGLLKSDGLIEEDLEEIAEHFGVSAKVVEHQIQNQMVAATP